MPAPLIVQDISADVSDVQAGHAPLQNGPFLITQQSGSENESEMRRRWLEAFESQKSGSVHDFKTSSQRQSILSEDNARDLFVYHDTEVN